MNADEYRYPEVESDFLVCVGPCLSVTSEMHQ
jgi:hypothetical protein